MSTTPLRQGRLAAVIDGDTVDLITGSQTIRVRLACVDAPELAQKPHGQLAKDALTGLLNQGTTVRYQPTSTDRYGRVVAEVFDRNNRNLGAQMVSLGRAFVDPSDAAACDATTLMARQNQARQQRLGVWLDPALQKPWDFRARTPQVPLAKTVLTQTVSSQTASAQISSNQTASAQTASASIASLPAAPTRFNVEPYRGKRVITCSSIDSKLEAQAWLAAGHRYLDADRDGCACESQFPC